MSPRTGLIVIDALLFALLIARLIVFKRRLNRYRPPSPLTHCKLGTHSRLTMVRWS